MSKRVSFFKISLAATAVAVLKRSTAWAMIYGVLVGIGFLASPSVQAMGVGFFALNMPAMIVTVLIAHVAYGLVLGLLLRRWLPDGTWLYGSAKQVWRRTPHLGLPAEIR